MSHLVPEPAPALPPDGDPAAARTLTLLAAGASNLEICQATGLPIAVVKAHVRWAGRTSGLTRRPEIAAWAARWAIG